MDFDFVIHQGVVVHFVNDFTVINVPSKGINCQVLLERDHGMLPGALALLVEGKAAFA